MREWIADLDASGDLSVLAGAIDLVLAVRAAQADDGAVLEVQFFDTVLDDPLDTRGGDLVCDLQSETRLAADAVAHLLGVEWGVVGVVELARIAF